MSLAAQAAAQACTAAVTSLASFAASCLAASGAAGAGAGVAAGSGSGATVWTFSNLGASDYVFVAVNRWEASNANQLQLQRGDGSPIATFPTLVSGAVTIFWNGTRWIAHMVSGSGVTVP